MEREMTELQWKQENLQNFDVFKKKASGKVKKKVYCIAFVLYLPSITTGYTTN